eukprot:XP_011672916.1 PREDICTED: uncharacterized protein LOC105436408 [Strongylocentrotus purpuratus]
MNFRRNLLLYVSGMILLHCFTSAVGQASPEYDKFRKSLGSSHNDLTIFKEILANRGLDYDRALFLMNNDQALNEYLSSKLPKIKDLVKRAALRPKNLVSDDHVYVFEGEDDDAWQISEKCVVDVMQYYRDLINGVYYADRMRASAGRIPRGAQYTGTLKDLGNIWLCTSTLKNETSNVPQFNGKYCPSAIRDTGIILGSCWPDSCSEMDVNSISSLFWSEVVKVEPFMYFDCQERRSWTTADIGFSVAMGFFALMVGLGSFYEVFLQKLVIDKMKGNDKQNKVHTTNVKNTMETQFEADHESEHALSHASDRVSDHITSSADWEERKVEVIAKTEEEMEGGARINGGFKVDGEETPTDVTEVKKVPFKMEDAEDGDAGGKPPKMQS